MKSSCAGSDGSMGSPSLAPLFRTRAEHVLGRPSAWQSASRTKADSRAALQVWRTSGLSFRVELCSMQGSCCRRRQERRQRQRAATEPASQLCCPVSDLPVSVAHIACSHQRAIAWCKPHRAQIRVHHMAASSLSLPTVPSPATSKARRPVNCAPIHRPLASRKCASSSPQKAQASSRAHTPRPAPRSSRCVQGGRMCVAGRTGPDGWLQRRGRRHRRSVAHRPPLRPSARIAAPCCYPCPP